MAAHGFRLTPAEVDASAGAALTSRMRLVLLRLARRIRQRPMPGVTPSQQSVVVVLDRFGDMTVGELATRESIQPASLTRILDSLESAGFISRERHPSDRRSVIVGLTDAGRDIAIHVHEERDAWLAQRIDGLSPRDRAVLSAALPVLEGLLDEPELSPGPEVGTDLDR